MSEFIVRRVRLVQHTKSVEVLGEYRRVKNESVADQLNIELSLSVPTLINEPIFCFLNSAVEFLKVGLKKTIKDMLRSKYGEELEIRLLNSTLSFEKYAVAVRSHDVVIAKSLTQKLCTPFLNTLLIDSRIIHYTLHNTTNVLTITVSPAYYG